MCSANARPGAPGGIDCQHLSERLGVRTQGAFPWAYSRLRIGVRIFTQLGGCDPNIYPARRAATRIFTQLGELLRRARRRRLGKCVIMRITENNPRKCL